MGMRVGVGSGVRWRRAMVAELAASRIAPETLTAFRLGQLLLLLDAADALRVAPVDIDRLGFYDFFAANPFLIVEKDHREGRALQMAGFEYENLDYQSSSQRFSNRRARLQHDLALLTAYGLLSVAPVDGRVGYGLTELGKAASAKFSALYAHAYRESARVVIRRLKGLSDTKLRADARSWLAADDLMIDLYE